MTEFEGLYTAIVKFGPSEIKENLDKIPGIHQQEALDNALEKAISLAETPKIINVKYLIELGADPNGPSGNEGIVLSHAYRSDQKEIVDLLLEVGADVNASHSNVLEQSARGGDLEHLRKFVEAGGDIHDTSRLVFSSDLISSAKNYPEIQKYLQNQMDLAVQSATPKNEVNIEDFSKMYIVIRGDTKEHQELLRKHKGRFMQKLRGGKGWLLPVKSRESIEKALKEQLSTKTNETTEAESTPKSTKQSEQEEMDAFMAKARAKNKPPRPDMKESQVIELYTPMGEYGYMTVGYTQPKLFNLDSHMWDSIERYLMYKTYEESFKGNAIRDAETLADAYKQFGVNKVAPAKTPKQLVLNQKLRPLADSKTNTGYFRNRENIFYKANKAKFTQNKLLYNNLLKTTRDIKNKNSLDPFGYEGNLLGNTLMKIRNELGGGNNHSTADTEKTNSLIIERYPGNKNFYVIRGDPDSDLGAIIRGFGTYKTKNGKIIRGKLNLNLQGGAGWLIPYTKRGDAKEMVFETFPDEKKIQFSGHKWVKDKIKPFLDVAILFSLLRGHQEVESNDVMFAIKDAFGAEEFLGEDNGEPAERFKSSVQKYVYSQDAVISDAAIQLLWDFMSKMVMNLARDVETYQQLREIMNRVEATILDTSIGHVEGLTERESIIIHSFVRLYKLLRKLSDKDTKVCVTVVHMMIGTEHYEEIRKIYSKKAKIQSNDEYPDEETQFRRRFRIKSPHIGTILDVIPHDLSKKCKLLLLTTMDYIMDLEGNDAIAISKRLIILSQKGRQPSPTPAPTPTPVPETESSEEISVEELEKRAEGDVAEETSDIPKLPLDGSEPEENEAR